MRADTTTPSIFSGGFELIGSVICWFLHARLLPPWLIHTDALRIWDWPHKNLVTFLVLATILMASGFGFSVSAWRHVHSRLRGLAMAMLLLNAASIVMLFIFLCARMLQ